MNFYVILAAVHVFREFWYTVSAADIIFTANSKSYFEVVDDSPKKLEQIRNANEEILRQVLHGYSLQGPAQTIAEQRIQEFESSTSMTFTGYKPRKDKKAERLWEKARKASDEYLKIKNKYQRDKFCDSNLYYSICPRAFQQPYFKEEKLTYSKILDGDLCIVSSYLLNVGEENVEHPMHYKSCSAKKKNDDGTESLVKVYLRAAPIQPFIGEWKFFVLFKYIQNPTTGEWERPSDPNDEDAGKYMFRFEAYLSLS